MRTAAQQIEHYKAVKARLRGLPQTPRIVRTMVMLPPPAPKPAPKPEPAQTEREKLKAAAEKALAAATTTPLDISKLPSQPKRVVGNYKAKTYETHRFAPLAKAIRAAVCKKHGLTLAEVMSTCREWRLIYARHEIMWELRDKTNWGFERIANFLGRSDHTSAVHGVAAHERRLKARKAQ